ncbi:hypothetical protein SS50377_26592 [Spironucleus salmonicida]|uniref:Uncharacterized protein n=1 Tax=Spironucleus salmonicida TaxID=348837 RepID=A0A9P8LQW1_9EUKA|nr:hypothetical protein SS50377_26592 [Spironucleus salmonicida]
MGRFTGSKQSTLSRVAMNLQRKPDTIIPYYLTLDEDYQSQIVTVFKQHHEFNDEVLLDFLCQFTKKQLTKARQQPYSAIQTFKRKNNIQ